MGRPTKYTASSSSGRNDGSSSASLMNNGSNLASRVSYSIITSWLQAPSSLRSLLQHHLLLQHHHSLYGASNAAAGSLPWLLATTAAASSTASPDVSLSPDSTVKESQLASSGVDGGPGIVKRECDTAWEDQAVNLCQRANPAAAAASLADALKVGHVVPSWSGIASSSTSR